MNLAKTNEIYVQELAPLESNKVIILDRDGTLNRDTGYVHRKEDFFIIPESISFLERAVVTGFGFVLATNQGGVALGKFSIEHALEFNATLAREFVEKGIVISAAYICFHHPLSPDLEKRHCFCRKPKPGLLNKILIDYELDSSKTWMIGDQETDSEAATKAGIGFRKIGDQGLWDLASAHLEDF
jgi:D-glycero-D-manno-heptose 1,7-bisphosphate phosphatase